MSCPVELYLRDVLDIPEEVLAGDFKMELSGGFDAAEQRVDEYVVTPQLRGAFRRSLNLVKAAVLGGKSEAAYLHGSFGSGKSHFMTVLHAILDDQPAARRKAELQEIIAEHDGWLRRRRFMMVPFHLIGAADLDSAILGTYAAEARRRGMPSPLVDRHVLAALLDIEMPRVLGKNGPLVPRLVLVHGRYRPVAPTEFSIRIGERRRQVRVSDQTSVLSVIDAWAAHHSSAVEAGSDAILVVTIG